MEGMKHQSGEEDPGGLFVVCLWVCACLPTAPPTPPTRAAYLRPDLATPEQLAHAAALTGLLDPGVEAALGYALLPPQGAAAAPINVPKGYLEPKVWPLPPPPALGSEAAAAAGGEQQQPQQQPQQRSPDAAAAAGGAQPAAGLQEQQQQ